MYDRVEAAGYCPSSLPALNHKHFVMKKLTLILFALLTAVTESRAVGDSLLRVNMAMDRQIRQKPGSEKLLAEYLNSLPAVFDTVYAKRDKPNMACKEVGKEFQYGQCLCMQPHSTQPYHTS